MIGITNQEGIHMLQSQLIKQMEAFTSNTAIVIDHIPYTYSSLLDKAKSFIAGLTGIHPDIRTVGIIANHDFETYAAILGCLISNITYIPIEPTHPLDRNKHIISIAHIEHIACSNMQELDTELFDEYKKLFIPTSYPEASKNSFIATFANNPAYVLFTSGTTGIPKGVPISLDNLGAFTSNVKDMNLGIEPTSRFLQVFDLTFDLSVFSYLIPLLNGAAFFTLPKTPLKYTIAIQLIEDYELTHILTVPSFVHFLQPYFEEIYLPKVKNWLFCGEALKTDLVKEWQKCLANASIYNVYGPTEATIFCTSYLCPNERILEKNGIVSIGKPFNGTVFLLHNIETLLEEKEKKGELLIAGNQLTTGYMSNETKNRAAFMKILEIQNYRTGDICTLGIDGNYYFLGRNDSQVKVQGGYRVELGEIENKALKIVGIQDTAAIAKEDSTGISVIYLFIIGDETAKQEIEKKLKLIIPAYMYPRKLIFVKEFPLNVNGKVDRKGLAEQV